ncbi:hypothetical protein GCM10009801_82090 [Streptomyces albiaxialis]|uniref:Uncharacterized protein n=1 Tax=Streptomyces albiaxialis TaxID=329523 RepID=A0ABN2X764_9ACTN
MTTTDQLTELLKLADQAAPLPWYVEEIRYNANGGIINYSAAPDSPMEPDATSTTWAIYGATGYPVAEQHVNHGPEDDTTPTEIAAVRAAAHLIVAAVDRTAAQLGAYDEHQDQPPAVEEDQDDDATAYLSPARVPAWLAFTDVGWSPVEHESAAVWREELQWEHDRLKTKVIAVGTSELDTVRRAIAEGKHEPGEDCADDAEALARAKHGCMSHWRRTPYGVAWLDDSR